MLTDKGYKDLKKAIAACTITNLSLMFPFAVTIQVFAELLKPMMAQEISWTRMWFLFGCGLVSALLVFLASKNDYKKPMSLLIWKQKIPGSVLQNGSGSCL